MMQIALQLTSVTVFLLLVQWHAQEHSK
jgi:hypothetical protein